MKDNNNRKKIPAKLLKVLQKEVKSKCPICYNEDVGHLEVHHIDGNRENDIEMNLIMLCPTCHSKVTKGDIIEREIIELKINLIKGKVQNDKPKIANQTININAPVNKSVVANTVNAHILNYKGKSKPKINHPEGSIGSNLNMRNYIKHLIDRYQLYMKADKTKNERSKYTIINNAIKKEFGVDSYTFVQIEKFYDLINYVQMRIDNTIQGRINKSRGIKNYSSLQEYLDKLNLSL